MYRFVFTQLILTSSRQGSCQTKALHDIYLALFSVFLTLCKRAVHRNIHRFEFLKIKDSWSGQMNSAISKEALDIFFELETGATFLESAKISISMEMSYSAQTLQFTALL